MISENERDNTVENQKRKVSLTIFPVATLESKNFDHIADPNA